MAQSTLRQLFPSREVQLLEKGSEENMQREWRDCRNQGFTTAIIFHERKPATASLGTVQAMEVCSPTEHQVVAGKGFVFVLLFFCQGFTAIWENPYKKIENLGNK